MKNIKRIIIGLTLLLTIGYVNTGCFGEFRVFNQVAQWNNSMGEDVVKEIVFILFWIVPVYEVCLFVDAVVLNTIEYWTGEAVVGLKEGEIKEKIFAGKNGTQYKVTVSKTNIEIKQIAGKNKGEQLNMVYHSTDKSWYLEKNGKAKKMVTINDNQSITAHLDNGKNVFVSLKNNTKENIKSLLTNRNELVMK